MKEELKSGMESSHSLFGFLWQMATQTGWSLKYILWKVPYATLLLMAMDAPRYLSADEKKKRSKKITKKSALDFFQSQLKQ